MRVFGSARTQPDDPNYELASQLGRLLSQQGMMVITGGGPGIMQAGMEGAGREQRFGVNISCLLSKPRMRVLQMIKNW